MNTSYEVYDEHNQRMMHFDGPCRLAAWASFPDGWSIERFLGTVSQGMVSIEDVRRHAAEVEQP